MHLIAVRTDVLGRHPHLVRELMDVFAQAQDVAWHRYDDPGWSLGLWNRLALEEQDDAFGRDCWASGLAANRTAIDDFCAAATEQGLLARRPDVDLLFADV